MSVNKRHSEADDSWADRWLDTVASGTNIMSHRRLSMVDRLGGGVSAVRKVAKSKNVHLLLLKDDRGEDLIAASMNAFTVIC